MALNITANCCCKTADIRILTMINSLFVSSYYYKTISLIYHKERTTPDIKMENIQHHRSESMFNKLEFIINQVQTLGLHTWNRK